MHLFSMEVKAGSSSSAASVSQACGRSSFFHSPSGSKKYEFRKRLANKAVGKILMYSTAPIMKVVGEVQIVETISASPTALWESTKKFAGISRDKYREYYKGCKVAYAYRLGQVTRYEPPKELSEFNISSPPQSFIYLSE